MKKKAIEKIPFLKLPGVSKKKAAEYVAVTAIKEIEKEPHLFVEVYRNKQECKEIPVVRIAVTGKDFGTYFTASGRWSRGRITRNTWDNYGLIWRENDERQIKTMNELAGENVLYSRDDLERIQAFLKEITVRDKNKWWEYIDWKQQDILTKERNEKSARRWERRQQALKERGEQTPELPEQEILQYADNMFFHCKHFLYYKRHGSRADVACSGCGSVADVRWKPGDSYESRFEKRIEEPAMGRYGTCPVCGKKGEYMPQGRAKSFYRKAKYLFLGQQYGKEGMVFRYVEVEKEWQLEESCGKKGPEMVGASEKITGIEIARIYFEPGKKIRKDFHKHNPWKGKDFWDDCNLSGLASINIKAAPVMPETYKNMKGTFLRYSALEKYEGAVRDVNPVDYLERYLQTPQIEMLVKLNLFGVVKELVSCHYGIVAREDAERPDEFLGIRKEKVKLLMKHQGDTELLEVLQMEKRYGVSWTDEQAENLAEAGIDCMKCGEALQYMTVQKLLNRISKYAGCEFGTGCSHAVGRLRQTAQVYLDYLEMRKKLGYSLENTVYQQPRDLSAAHNRMVYESSQKEQDRRLKEAADRFPLIRKNYRKLRKQYFYEDDTYQIRPAKSAEEIVLEGRFLHHCVGGDGYLMGHNEGRNIILLLRFKKEPEIPYITVEIGKNYQIRQWFGQQDTKPDQQNMQKWLDAYVTRLKCGSMAAGMEKDAVRTRIMVTA